MVKIVKMMCFSRTNVDKSDSYFYMSFLNVYCTTICRLYANIESLVELKLTNVQFNNNYMCYIIGSFYLGLTPPF
jgi:hypothetical protein